MEKVDFDLISAEKNLHLLMKSGFDLFGLLSRYKYLHRKCRNGRRCSFTVPTVISSPCLPLIFSPSSLFPNGGRGGPTRDPPSPALTGLHGRGWVVPVFISKHTHTHACVRACVRARSLTNTRSLRQIQPALSAQALLELFFFFFWRSGTANDTQLSVPTTGGGQREGRGGKDERRAKQIRQPPPNFGLSCAAAHSYAGSVFCSTSGLFFLCLFPGEERRKKRRGIGVHMT